MRGVGGVTNQNPPFGGYLIEIGLPGIEPGLQDPQPRVLPLYYSPL